MSEQVFHFNRPGKIVINDNRGRPCKPPQQSKGQPHTVRFLPELEDRIDRARRAERIEFTAFIEKTAEVGTVYTLDQVETLLSNPDVFGPLLDAWRKR